VQEVDRLIEARDAAGRFVAVGYQHMFAPTTMAIKSRLLDGQIGTVRSFTCRGLWPRLDSYYARNAWAGRLRSGDAWVLDSPFNNALAHDLVMMCFLAGTSPETPAGIESVEAELYRAHEIESADTACLRIRTTSGLTLHFYVTHASEAHFGPETLVEGDDGTLVRTPRDATIRRRGSEPERLGIASREDLGTHMLDALHRRLCGENAFICTLEVARAQTVVADAAHESSAIHTIPPKYIARREEKDSIKTVVEGLDEAIGRCAAEKKLFSEIGLPWARPGVVFSTTGYGSFDGGRTAE
jgi:predicted dehydrogenase